jgi:hypothetical protein
MRKCKKCGARLSEYNPTGQCYRHSVPPDACGEWEPQLHHGLKGSERREMRVEFEASAILGKSGGFCSAGGKRNG